MEEKLEILSNALADNIILEQDVNDTEIPEGTVLGENISDQKILSNVGTAVGVSNVEFFQSGTDSTDLDRVHMVLTSQETLPVIVQDEVDVVLDSDGGEKLESSLML